MGKLALTKTWVDMDAFLREIILTIQPSHPHHPLVVSGNTHQQIYVDKDRLGQVLINLLSNAIKYSPQTALIEVSIAADQEMVTTTVRDQGVGIPKEHLPIFLSASTGSTMTRTASFPDWALDYTLVLKLFNDIMVESG